MITFKSMTFRGRSIVRLLIASLQVSTENWGSLTPGSNDAPADWGSISGPPTSSDNFGVVAAEPSWSTVPGQYGNLNPQPQDVPFGSYNLGYDSSSTYKSAITYTWTVSNVSTERGPDPVLLSRDVNGTVVTSGVVIPASQNGFIELGIEGQGNGGPLRATYHVTATDDKNRTYQWTLDCYRPYVG